jgi:two-component system CheB/CheR fusion protein
MAKKSLNAKKPKKSPQAKKPVLPKVAARGSAREQKKASPRVGKSASTASPSQGQPAPKEAARPAPPARTAVATTAQPTAPAAERDHFFPIVAIGASAGGLAALKELFKHFPADSGLAFVIVVHLSPDHESHLEDLLRPHVKMPMQQVRQTVAIEQNHVYIIPPNANLDTIDTHLRLTELEKRRHERAPIDHFFRTLANTHDGNAIGVILTGTGSDGTQGLRQIKERGGLTVVQDPNEAEYDGMPRSALAAAPVDAVLPLAKIPEAVMRFAQTRPRLSISDESEEGDAEARQLLQSVFAQIRARTGRDFSHYKRSTLLRRITRRMQFHHLQEPGAYLELLRKKPEEAQALSDDLLITVTSFFRDTDVFEALERDVIPRLFDNRGNDDVVRVWSVGCATGEEAYSLSILLLEEAERRESSVSIQVFASDLHPHSLAQAREGFYPGDIEADVRPDRLKRFFQKESGGYRVRKEVRELVVFTPHNILADPPFSRLDLISCRNLLIYLQRPLQQQVAELFHYALKQDGYILLGSSENIDAVELFRVEDKKRCIYRKRNVPGPEPRLPVFPLMQGRLIDGRSRGPQSQPIAYGTLHQRLLEEQGPPSVLVSPDDNVVHFSSHAGRYLVHPAGTPTTSLFKLVRDELRIELRAALSTARAQRKAVRTHVISVRFHDQVMPVVLDVRPALDVEQEGFCLLIFDERPAAGRSDASSGPTRAEAKVPGRMRALEAEKQLAEQRLQAIIEEYETSQEEIRASNEELQSANEELRSTLEELETSKEELQSMNEELQTVNQENRYKVEELSQLSNDLQNLLAATDIATLFLDRELRITRFTPRIAELFNVRMTDRGRPLSDFTHRLGYDGLHDDALSVFSRLVPIERELQDKAGLWYLTRILPYRSGEDRIAGVVVTFVEITRRKLAEDTLRTAQEQSEKILEGLPEPLLVLDSELRVQSANAAFYEQFQMSAEHTEGRKLYALGNGQWDAPALRTLLEDILPGDSTFSEYQVDHVFPNVGRRIMLLNARRLDDRQLILLGMHDMTGRFEAEQALRASELRLAAELAAMQQLHALVTRLVTCADLHSAMEEVLAAAMAITNATKGNVQLLNPQHDALEIVAQRGFAASFLATFRAVTLEDDSACGRAWRARARVIIEDVNEDESFTPYRDAAQEAGYRGVQSTPLLSREGELLGVLSTHYPEPYRMTARDTHLLDLYAQQAADFIERLGAQDALRDSKVRLVEENLHKDEYLAMLGHELRNPVAAIRDATELLKMAESEDPQLRHACEVLSRQSEHVARIIDGLLDMARLVRGKVQLQQVDVDLRTLVEQLLEELAPKIEARGLRLEKHLPQAALWIRGDEIRLLQICDNLLGNAIKFTSSPGSITVDLSSQGEFAVLRIRDTGLGIRPSMLPRIFDSFQQERQDVARSTGGLGLGLALAKGFVALHKGTISAHSEGLGRGAEFEVTLPLTPAPTTDQRALLSVPPPARRILLVEDNADAGQMLRSMLRRRGHQVEVAESGLEALHMLHEQSIEVVLCDIGLPGMSGYEVAHAIRQDPALRDVLLIALTGYSQPEDREQSARAGFNHHLVKPVDLRELDGVLRQLGPTVEPILA